LIALFPDGFRALFAPAAALPAPLLGMPVVEVPVVVPLTDDPVVAPVAGAPVVELAPAEPVPLCASANVLVSVSAAANPRLVSLMGASFLMRKDKRPRRDMFLR
jgi:hypothetical protein